MTKNLAKIGVLLLLCFVATGGSCLTVEKDIDFVLTDTVRITFDEHHENEIMATPETIYITAEFDSVLVENEISKDDIKEIRIIRVTYEVLDGVSDPPPGRYDDWLISGAIEVRRTDVGAAASDTTAVAAVAYDSVALKAVEGIGPIPAVLESEGIELIHRAIDAYLDLDEEPALEFQTVHGDVDPSPSDVHPLDFTWRAEVEFYVVVTESFEFFQLF